MKKAKSASRGIVEYRRHLRAFVARHIRRARDYHEELPAESAGCHHSGAPSSEIARSRTL